MNKTPLITILFSACSIFQAAGQDYLTYIWQVNTWYDELGNKQVLQKKLADLPTEGTREAAEGIMGTSEFFLYAEDTDTGEDHLLDSASASAYTNDAVLSFEGPSADPYNLNLREGEIPRTQVGQGFTLKYTVNGLLENDTTASDAARKLDFYREVYQYGSNQTALLSGQTPTLSYSSEIDKNGYFEFHVNTAIPSGSDITKTRGLERFIISSKADYKTKAAIITTADIHVWPISDGSMSGLTNNETYQNVPTVNISLIDLYPSSDTYLEISSTELDEPIIYGSRKNTNNVPISVDYSLTSLNSALENDGTYTIRLLHVSPFDTLVFDTVTINVKRNIKYHGKITTSEE